MQQFIILFVKGKSESTVNNVDIKNYYIQLAKDAQLNLDRKQNKQQ